MIIELLEDIGLVVVHSLEGAGQTFRFAVDTCVWAVRPPYDVWEWLRQMRRVGLAALPVVLLTAAFTGMVLTLQTFQGFERFRAESYVGTVVAISVLREISPVLTALMVNARSGSAIAAEIGTMRVTEQIDALVSMSTNPVQYLFVPRVFAGITMVPLLVAVADAVAIVGGRLVAVALLGASPDEYDRATFRNLDLVDFWSGLLKGAVFGAIITLVACARGHEATGGAEGAGRAATRAVVTASVGIVITDFFISKLIF